ncbi:MAG TPA: D-alanyl-D-alanine carboxypeptidase family protein [Thermohalobaculum sp.]|nr:D-alanyl-D-alanine carboxypeptidase family protein [Thermohalobaculum sp.]
MLKILVSRLVFAAALVLAAAMPAGAQPQTTPARAAIVIDMSSGAVLLEKEADTPLPPASMSKLMTLDLVFEALESGRLSLEDMFRTSARAASMGGSKMFIREGGQVSVADLLRGVIVQSGNDAAVALAEAVSGTEEAFARLMNQRAADLGLTNSRFANATGWPAPDHWMSPRDLARLAERLITHYPEHYPMFAETEFTWAEITQKNRNPLLYDGVGADGLKTGHTEEAGYGLVASAVRDGRRILLVVNGLESSQQRSQEAERLINWAFRAFETRTLYKAGTPVAEAAVWIGAAPSVALTPARDVVVTVPYGLLDQAQITARYDGPVEAPIAAGDEIGRLDVALPGIPPVSVPLVAAAAVERGGIAARLQAAGLLLMRRLLDREG